MVTYTIIRRGAAIRNEAGEVTGYEPGTSGRTINSDGSRRTIESSAGTVYKSERTYDAQGRMTIGENKQANLQLEQQKNAELRAEAQREAASRPQAVVPEETAASMSIARREDLQRGFGQTLARQEDLDRGTTYAREEAQREQDSRVIEPTRITGRERKKIETRAAIVQLDQEFFNEPSLGGFAKSQAARFTLAGMGAVDLIEGRTKQLVGAVQVIADPTDKYKTPEQGFKENKLFLEGSEIISGAVPSKQQFLDNPITGLPLAAGLSYEVGASSILLSGITQPQVSTSITRSNTNLRVSTTSTGSTTSVGKGVVRVTEVVEQPLLRVTVPKSVGGMGADPYITAREFPFRTIGASSVRPNTSGSRAVTTDFDSDLLVNINGKDRLLSRTSGVLVDDVGSQVTKTFDIKTGKLASTSRSSVVSKVYETPNEGLYTFSQTSKSSKLFTRSRFEEVGVEDIAGVRVSRGELVQSSFEPQTARGVFGKKGQVSIGRSPSGSSFDTGSLLDDASLINPSVPARGSLLDDTSLINPSRVGMVKPSVPARGSFNNLGVLDESFSILRPKPAVSGRLKTGVGTSSIVNFGSVPSVVGNSGVKAIGSSFVGVEPLPVSSPLPFLGVTPYYIASSYSITSSTPRTYDSFYSPNGGGTPSIPRVSDPGFSYPKGGFIPPLSVSLGGGGSGPKYYGSNKKSKKVFSGIPPTLIGALYGVGKKTKRGGTYSGLEVRR